MIAAIIQARLGSIRLPGKVLLELYEGKPMLWHVLNRVKKAKILDDVILATSTKVQDVSLVKVAEEQNIKWFIGSEDNVLERFYRCATWYGIKTIVRVTADCPLIDPDIIDEVVNYYKSNSYDYVSNSDAYPDGLDVEVFSFEALRKTYQETKDKYDCEHVTPYMLNNPEIFKIGSLPNNTEFTFPKSQKLHWSVDTPDDMKFVRRLYDTLGNDFRLEDVVKYLGLGVGKPKIKRYYKEP